MTREIRIVIAVVALSLVGAFVVRDAVFVDASGWSLYGHECSECHRQCDYRTSINVPSGSYCEACWNAKAPEARLTLLSTR